MEYSVHMLIIQNVFIKRPLWRNKNKSVKSGTTEMAGLVHCI